MSNNFPDIKQVCIYGTGGVGGYFGGRIAEVFAAPQFSEYAVYFIARGAHLEAIKQHGIIVKTPERTISARPNLATNDINEIPSPDLVLLCVKSYDLNQAVMAIKPKMKDSTVIIPLLNGVDIYDRIRLILDNGIVLPACLYLGTHIESPGVINQSGGNGIIISGPDRKIPGYTGEKVKAFFQKTGITYEWYDDPLPKIWEKYMFIAAFGLVTARYGEGLGTIMANQEHRKMARGIMEEINAIASMKNIKLPEDIVEKSMGKAFNFPNDARTSYQRDIESGSRFNEGDLFGATIIREGKALGVATPITESVYKRIMDYPGKSS
ncbi:MAG: ketopantoate reductase family protein [Dehalococcoidales bacterium]